MIAEKLKTQLRIGILEYCAMQILHRGEVYASDMIEELLAAKLISVEGVVYPLLIRFKNEGLVRYDWVDSESGLPKKHYQLTDDGISTVKALDQTWDEITKTTEYFRARNSEMSGTNSDSTSKK
ncbi:PadR family transcriptional regulator [Marivirga sp. S37H4]|uniref:PadR family transcriptional regulator n=1 Tax=Marivirga aurantiaca TaxID=2802615 RepID=A0A935C7D4_9BACT|nr:PadR family transcriptional regulator [Marivirga aurantiaca]MBK6264849.1 PadR family transcriptional regulator [Marivirga aurantiaca]